MYTFTGGREPDKVYCTNLYSVNANIKEHLEDRYFLYFHAKEANRTICAVVTVGSNILTCIDSLDGTGLGRVLVAVWLWSEGILMPENVLSLTQREVVKVSRIESDLILERLKELAELQKDKDKN